jgi:hypothetical protein
MIEYSFCFVAFFVGMVILGLPKVSLGHTMPYHSMTCGHPLLKRPYRVGSLQSFSLVVKNFPCHSYLIGVVI